MRTRRFSAAAALLLTTACLSVDAPLPVRTFHPGRLEPAPAPAGAARTLRLDRVEASPLLSERMVWHLSDVELSIDELSRWSAPPAELVAEALRSALFESGACVRNELAPEELTVRVIAFGGDLNDAAPKARVRLVAALGSRETGQKRIMTFDASAPLAARDSAELARGIGRALSESVAALRAWVVEQGRGSQLD